jgi:chromosome segregation ATPase
MNAYGDSNINSIINRNENADNFSIPYNKQVTIDELLKRNDELNYLLSKYEYILKEYQNKYGNDLYNQVENKLSESDNQNMNFFNKNILESVSLVKELEIKLQEKDHIIKQLLNEKANIESDNNKLKAENYNLEQLNENLQKNNDEIYNALNERTKKKQNNIFNKTLDFNAREKGNEILGDGEVPLNMNSNININKNNISDQNFYNTMKENYNNFLMKEKKDYQEKYEYEDMIKKYKIENENLRSQVFSLQNKLKEEMEEITKLENDSNLKQISINQLEINVNTLKPQIEEYKNSYESLENRKNKETDNLLNELKEMRAKLEEYKRKNNKLEDDNSRSKNIIENLNLKIGELNSELQLLQEMNKFNDDALKINKDSQYLENLNKREIDNLNLEKEKINKKLQMKEEQIRKINAEYSNLFREKINEFENLNAITKNKYEEIIRNKENEIKDIKASILTYKFERDKYLSDCNLYKNEYDKINQTFHTENDYYIKQFEQAKTELNNISSKNNGIINELQIKNNQLENENKRMNDNINSLQNDKKKYEQNIKHLEAENNDLQKENNYLKQNNDKYMREKSSYTKELEKLHSQHKYEREQDKEINQNKIIQLENIVEKQKKQLSTIEGKAWDMVKKQQAITEKYKKELKETINYYEGIINGKASNDKF